MGLLTATVGWFPKPPAVRRARWRLAEGEIDEAAARAVVDEATRECVREQERIGLDQLVDGQLDRSDMITHFAEHIEGMESLGFVRCFGNRYYRRPRIVGDVERTRPIALHGFAVASEATSRPVKAVLTGPYTLMDWSFDEHYGSRENCCLALAEIVRAEAEDLVAAGAREIQIDEPALTAHPEEFELAAAALGRVTAGLRGRARTWTHMAYGDTAAALERIFALPVDGLLLEMANSSYGFVDALAGLPADKLLGAGVIDVLDDAIESVDAIRRRVDRLVACVGAERLWLVPDAGLRTLPPETALSKLRALVTAAAAH